MLTRNLLPPLACTSLNDISSRSTQDSVPCGLGYYSLQGEPLCTPCPAGYRCPQARDSPIACDPGYYRYISSGTPPSWLPIWSQHVNDLLTHACRVRRCSLPSLILPPRRGCHIRFARASALISSVFFIIFSTFCFLRHFSPPTRDPFPLSPPHLSSPRWPFLTPCYLPSTRPDATQRITWAALKRRPTAPPARRDTSATTPSPRPSLVRSGTTAVEGLRSARPVSRGTAAPRPPSAQLLPVRSAPKERIVIPRGPSSSARLEPTVSCWRYLSPPNRLALSCPNRG